MKQALRKSFPNELSEIRSRRETDWRLRARLAPRFILFQSLCSCQRTTASVLLVPTSLASACAPAPCTLCAEASFSPVRAWASLFLPVTWRPGSHIPTSFASQEAVLPSGEGGRMVPRSFSQAQPDLVCSRDAELPGPAHASALRLADGKPGCLKPLSMGRIISNWGLC